MAHSVKKRKQRERIQRNLNVRATNLKKLAKKHYKEAINITLPEVALGDLRAKFKHTHYALHPVYQRLIHKFERIPINQTPLFIRGSDGGLLVCRVPLNRSELVEKLDRSIEALPPNKRYKFKGVQRSDYEARHLCVWAAYQPKPFLTREYRDYPTESQQFLDDNAEVWYHMSGLLGEAVPSVFKRLQMYPMGEDGLKRLCSAWCGCVVNKGGNSPDQTQIHRDVKESIYGYSCIISTGDFTGGALILWDLKLILEMAPGDMVLFPDSLIHHSNEPAIGRRNSIVTFTQENMYDYWHREFGLTLRRKTRKPKKKTVKKCI
jgi:hypothetical protein